MRFIGLLILSLILGSKISLAGCPAGDEASRSRGLLAAMPVYEVCALQKNDDETQLYLAQLYDRGQSGVARNVQRSLLFYHLSAENGNATAQVGLSKLLTRLDESDATRPEIRSYMEKIKGQLQNRSQTSFKGQMLHPYTLLLLAAEKPSAKWFYPTTVTSDPEAQRLLKQYEITPDKQKTSYAEATAWKQRKMLDVARDVFSVSEYVSFYDRLYPKQGAADPFTRSQAINELKEKLESVK